MSEFSYLNNANPDYIDNLYTDYCNDPNSVDTQWADFFKGYDFSNASKNGSYTTLTNNDVQVMKLIHAYRSRGHLIAQTNPIRQRRQHKADLELDYFNLSEYEKVTTLVPTFSIAYARLGSIHYKLGDLEKARENWEQSLELDPSNDSLKLFLKRITPSKELEEIKDDKKNIDISDDYDLLKIIPERDQI